MIEEKKDLEDEEDKSLDTLFIFTVTLDDGREAIVNTETASGMMPLVTLSEEKAKEMKEIAQSVADGSEMEIKMYRYGERVEEETFSPSKLVPPPGVLH